MHQIQNPNLAYTDFDGTFFLLILPQLIIAVI